MKTLLQKIESKSSCKVVFTDFFDTLVHRTVHPHYVVKLWGKFLIRELGLKVKTDELFAIRIDSHSYLSKKMNLRAVEVPYKEILNEVYRRLVNAEVLINVSFEHFCRIFQQADFVSETSVQFKNEAIVETLRTLSNKGYRIYLVTDFFLSKEVISKILEPVSYTHLTLPTILLV